MPIPVLSGARTETRKTNIMAYPANLSRRGFLTAMEVAGFKPETFEVILFRPSGQNVFGKYYGGEAV